MKGLRLSISLNRFWLPAPVKGLAALLAFALTGAPKGLLPPTFPNGVAGLPASQGHGQSILDYALNATGTTFLERLARPS